VAPVAELIDEGARSRKGWPAWPGCTGLPAFWPPVAGELTPQGWGRRAQALPRSPQGPTPGGGDDRRRSRTRGSRVVERTLGWLLSYQRLALRYDRSAATITALARLTITLICARRYPRTNATSSYLSSTPAVDRRPRKGGRFGGPSAASKSVPHEQRLQGSAQR
jgi:hypothetical protein